METYTQTVLTVSQSRRHLDLWLKEENYCTELTPDNLSVNQCETKGLCKKRREECATKAGLFMLKYLEIYIALKLLDY